MLLTVLVEEECAQLGIVGSLQPLFCCTVTLMKLLKSIVHQLLYLRLVFAVRSSAKRKRLVSIECNLLVTQQQLVLRLNVLSTVHE